MESALTGGYRLAFGIGAGLSVAAITVLRPSTAVQLEPAVASELPAAKEITPRLRDARRSKQQPARIRRSARPPVRSWRRSSEHEQLLAEDQKFEIAIGGGAAAKDEEFDQQPEERVEESQQRGQAE